MEGISGLRICKRTLFDREKNKGQRNGTEEEMKLHPVPFVFHALSAAAQSVTVKPLPGRQAESSLKKTEYSDHFSEDSRRIQNKILHRTVLGMQNYLAAL